MTVNSQVIQVATADGNDVVVAGGLKPGMLVVSAGVPCAVAGPEGQPLPARPRDRHHQPGADLARCGGCTGRRGACRLGCQIRRTSHMNDKNNKAGHAADSGPNDSQIQPDARKFNLSRWALEHGALTRYLLLVLMVLGFASYFQLGQTKTRRSHFAPWSCAPTGPARPRSRWPNRSPTSWSARCRKCLSPTDPQLFEARRVADHFPDQGFDPAGGGGQYLVRGTQKNR